MKANICCQLAKNVSGDDVLGAVDSVMSPIIVGAMSVKDNHDQDYPLVFD